MSGYTDLKLLPGNELDLSGGQIQFTTRGHLVRQMIQTRLLLSQGEWFLDLEFGFPLYQQVLVKNPSLPRIRSLIKKVILSVPYVLDVPELTLEYIARNDLLRGLPARSLLVRFLATTDLPDEPVIREFIGLGLRQQTIVLPVILTPADGSSTILSSIPVEVTRAPPGWTIHLLQDGVDVANATADATGTATFTASLPTP